jgi:hypothetical protein
MHEFMAAATTRARDLQVLSTVPVMFSYWAKPEDCLDLSMMLNDHLARCVKLHPKRFVGLGTVPMQAPTLAALEVRRCVTELGLAGVQIGSHVNSWTLAERELDPIWQAGTTIEPPLPAAPCQQLQRSFVLAAEDVGACIFIHPWDMIGTDLMKKYFLPWLVGMPAETSMAICSMMFAGVFERYGAHLRAPTRMRGCNDKPMYCFRLAAGFRSFACASPMEAAPSRAPLVVWSTGFTSARIYAPRSASCRLGSS